jgi:hypothetical protein
MSTEESITILTTQIGMFQHIFNGILVIGGGFGGYVINNISKSQKEAQTRDSELTEKVHAIEVLVAGQYITKDAHDKLGDALFQKLDSIEKKLDAVPCKNP